MPERRSYATKQELDEAIEAVRGDIRDTEDRLRHEFTSTVRYEVGRIGDHLQDQDHAIGRIETAISRIPWFLLTLLAGVVASLILLIR